MGDRFFELRLKSVITSERPTKGDMTMKTSLLAFAALGAVTVSASVAADPAPRAGVPEPIVLGAEQMDGVTAGIALLLPAVQKIPERVSEALGSKYRPQFYLRTPDALPVPEEKFGDGSVMPRPVVFDLVAQLPGLALRGGDQVNAYVIGSIANPPR
jgi:hypothetical protein